MSHVHLFQEDLLHDLPSHRHEAHQAVVARPSFLPFLNMGMMFLFFQSPGTSPDSYDFSDMMESGLATTSAPL